MTVKSDRWIRRMAAKGMIEPFEPIQVRSVDGHRVVSYGTSSYGYDIRCAPEFKIFTNINSTIVDPKVFDETRSSIKADRSVALMEFLKNFYSFGGADGKRVSERVIEANWNVAMGASPIGTLACVDSWIEDFRKDITRNDIPTMIIHGDDDRILPADATSRRQAKMIKGVKYVEIKGASHGLTWTRAEEINAELLKFLT